ncbi:MAG: hypothetical protein RBR12_05040 [Sulfurospirillum cavolei]|nr:hypothetical protein [Sulfurospirillum cavolei]
MLFSDDFIVSIANDPIQSLIKIVEDTSTQLREEKKMSIWTQRPYDTLFEAFSLVVCVIEEFDIEMLKTIEVPSLQGSLQDDANAMNAFLTNIYPKCKAHVAKINLSLMKNKFNGLLGQSFSYEFSHEDLDRVQQLINELREEINTSNLFEQKHKARLLKRLEKLQAELHKKMSDIDSFWGLVGDAGVAIGKFGNDAKPFVDRIREMTDIVWRTQSRAEELPSGTPTPLLENFDS